MCSFLEEIIDYQYTVDMEKLEANIDLGIVFTGIEWRHNKLNFIYFLVGGGQFGEEGQVGLKRNP